MASTIATFDAFLKERYTNKQTVQNLCFADRATLGKIGKDTEFQGRGHPVPVIIRAPLGIASGSGALANAQTNATTNSGAAGNIKGVEFMVTAGDLVGSVDIGEKVIRASRANPGAFLQNKQAEIDGLYGGCADVLAAAIQGNGTNLLGVSPNLVGTTITLTNPSDAMYFEQDMLLEASLNDGSATGNVLLAGTAYVTGRDLQAGTLTINALPGAWNGAGTLYLFRAGTFLGNVGNLVTHGFGSYITGAASPPALYGVSAADRLAEKQRLCGVVIPAAAVAGLGKEVRMQMLGSQMTGRAKGPGGKFWTMHPEDWQDLAISVQSRGTRPLTDTSTSFGYEYIDIVAGGVRGQVYADRFNPKGKARCWRLENWELKTMGEMLAPQNGDGLTMLRKATTLDYEYRLISFPGVSCEAPGWSGEVPV